MRAVVAAKLLLLAVLSCLASLYRVGDSSRFDCSLDPTFLLCYYYYDYPSADKSSYPLSTGLLLGDTDSNERKEDNEMGGDDRTLSVGLLHEIQRKVTVDAPAYDRKQLKPGWLHVGIGTSSIC